MFKELYLAIVAQLKTITDTDGTPLFKHFDIWNRNVEFIEQDQPFTCPACFVEFVPLKWESLGGRVQESAAVVRLHIVSRWFSQTADNSPVHEEALKHLELPSFVFNVLQCKTLSTIHTSGWMRTNSLINHNHAHYVDSIEEYTFAVREEPVATQQDVSPIELEITR